MTVMDPEVQQEKFPLPFDGQEYLGHFAYPLDTTEPRPLIIVVPNYAGLNEFDEQQCLFLAKIGFTALAIDVYGESCPFELRTQRAKVERPEEHRTATFRAMNAMLSDWDRFRAFLKAWVAAGKTHSAACSDRCAAIGYCFGGCAMLEMVRSGMQGVQGCVSFHGVLTSYPQQMPDGTLIESKPHAPNTYTTDIKLLIENGADGKRAQCPALIISFRYLLPSWVRFLALAWSGSCQGDIAPGFMLLSVGCGIDTLVPDSAIRQFQAEFDGAGVDWTFHNYSGTPHGFALGADTKPDGTRGYTEVADRRSTHAMLALFAELWPEMRQKHVAVNAAGTTLPPPVASAIVAVAKL
jgi:dienelactone hydrolase